MSYAIIGMKFYFRVVMRINLSFMLVLFLCSSAVSSPEFVVSCVDSSIDSPVLIAKAIADSEYLASNSPAIIEQSTEISVSSVDGLEVSRMSHDAKVEHKGRVRSEIQDKWKDGDQICVKVEFKKPLI